MTKYTDERWETNMNKKWKLIINQIIIDIAPFKTHQSAFQ